ncbi:MAG: DUF3365 domain-containing protein [Acidobacteriota bacterium]
MTSSPRRLDLVLRAGLVALAALLAGLVACQETSAPTSSSEADWAMVDETALGAMQRRQVERAEAARSALFGELMGTLMPLLQGGDTAGAIEVCKDRAPAIAAEVSARQELRIGRTSWKLRNPANAPPAWATPLLEGRPESPRFAAGPDGTLGATFPILVAEPCLRCHGQAESLAPTVRAALDDLYPDDRATGFAAGDLRGWFWVEVPAEDPQRSDD